MVLLCSPASSQVFPRVSAVRKPWRNRIPCDSGVFLKVLELAEGAVGLRLKQTTSQLLQLLGWFRANTLHQGVALVFSWVFRDRD